jgi:hypothetical protein
MYEKWDYAVLKCHKRLCLIDLHVTAELYFDNMKR